VNLQFLNPLHRIPKGRLQNLTPLANDWTNKLLTVKGKGKAVTLQVWSGPEGFRKLWFPDIVTMAQEGW
jgi:hypothetical protein